MTKDAPRIHELSDVQSEAIGAGTSIWQFVVILPGAQIGADCNICSHCFIENDVNVGDRVTIKNGVQVWDGLRIEDDVFVGPNAAFTNDPFPRSKQHAGKHPITSVGRGASIGANATLLPGIRIGADAMIGAGSVVTGDVPPKAIVVGNPGRITGYVDAAQLHDTTTGGQDLENASISVSGVKFCKLTHVPDLRGSLMAAEFSSQLPFKPERAFVVYEVPSSRVRGEHAHRECHQFLICLHGSVAVVVDDGRNSQEVVLDKADRGIHLPPMTWGIQYKYSSDAVLLVFASHPYDPEDYIRDYEEFRRLANEQ